MAYKFGSLGQNATKVSTSRLSVRLSLAASMGAIVVAGTSPAFGQEFAYDVQGRLTTIVYLNGKVVTICYDDAGNRTRHVVGASVANCSGGSSPPPPPPPPPPPGLPVAVDDFRLTTPFSPLAIFPMANDTNAMSITSVGAVSPSSGATVTHNGATVTFSATLQGTYTFNYTITNGGGAFDTGVISVTVFDECVFC